MVPLQKIQEKDNYESHFKVKYYTVMAEVKNMLIMAICMFKTITLKEGAPPGGIWTY